MDHYYVNDNAQDTGEHEVHKDSCIYFSKIVSRTDLGYFSNCHEAVKKASQYYEQVDGCKVCSIECHKR